MSVIEIEELTKTYFSQGMEVNAVSGINLSVEQGTVFGFLGPNGAGKTTTMKMVVGLAYPDSGSISIFGGSPGDLAVRRRIGFMPETPAFYPHLNGWEFMGLAADLFDLPNDRARSRNAELLKMVGLLEFKELPIRKYSKGMLQRLGLAQALVNDPDLVFLDEPLDGLDPLGRADAKKLLLDLRRSGKTIFFNSHILADVEDVCGHVGIIDRGKIIAEGAIGEIKGDFSSLEEAFVSIIRSQRKIS